MRTPLTLLWLFVLLPLFVFADPSKADPSMDDLLHQSERSMRTPVKPTAPIQVPSQPVSPHGASIVAVVILMTATLMAVTSLLTELRFTGRLPRRVRIRWTRRLLAVDRS